MTNLEKKPSPPIYGALTAFYRQILQSGGVDDTIAPFIDEISKITQHSITNLPLEELVDLNAKFENILRERFEEWRTVRVKPPVWLALTPK